MGAILRTGTHLDAQRVVGDVVGDAAVRGLPALSFGRNFVSGLDEFRMKVSHRHQNRGEPNSFWSCCHIRTNICSVMCSHFALNQVRLPPLLTRPMSQLTHSPNIPPQLAAF